MPGFRGCLSCRRVSITWLAARGPVSSSQSRLLLPSPLLLGLSQLPGPSRLSEEAGGATVDDGTKPGKNKASTAGKELNFLQERRIL